MNNNLEFENEDPRPDTVGDNHPRTNYGEGYEVKETLEEVAKIFVNNRFTKQICGDEFYPDIHASKEAIVESHVLFTKWQQEQDKNKYSEEDMREAFKDGSLVASWSDMGISMKYDTFEDWFDKFKKK